MPVWVLQEGADSILCLFGHRDRRAALSGGDGIGTGRITYKVRGEGIKIRPVDQDLTLENLITGRISISIRELFRGSYRLFFLFGRST